MTQALIWYKQRQRAAKERRAQAVGQRPAPPAVRPDEGGAGVVVFDVETTRLIEEDVEAEDMEVSVACATWLPAAASVADSMANAASRAFWHSAVTRDPWGGDYGSGRDSMLVPKSV